MNHYPHHIGDFVKDTMGFNQGAIGAYRLLMDAYYANEAAPAAEDVYVIGRATTAAERKNVDRALTKFELRDGRYFHKRVEEELAAFRVRSDQATKNIRKRWEKPYETDTERHTKSHTEDGVGVILASSHKPVKAKPQYQASPQVSTDGDSIGARGAAALAGLKPDASPPGRIEGGEGTPAGTLAAVLHENGLRGNAFHPLVVEWAREGITPDRLKSAIAKARQRPGKETGRFGPEYLDPILHDTTKPAAEVHAQRATDDAAKRIAKTEAKLAEQREDAARAAPPPDDLMAAFRRGKTPEEPGVAEPAA